MLDRITNRQPQDVFYSDGLTLLVLGCDEDRAPGGKKVTREYARSDMILVARLDFKEKRVGGISIPRDLEVQLPGYRAQKINAYHSIGGKLLAQRAVEQVIGLPVDRVVVLNYEAFQELVNMVGGVEVFIEKKLKYTDRAGDLYIDLEPGRQKLDGYEAMGFVRMRHTDDDFQRMKRQREFMLALKDSVMQKPSILPTVVEKAADVLGSELSSDEMAALGGFMQKVKSDSIKLAALPVLPGHGYNLLLDSANLRKVLEETYLVPAPTDPARLSLR
jgi:LCP family protein required for cell wall assembly